MGAGFGVLAIIVIVAGVLFDRLVHFCGTTRIAWWSISPLAHASGLQARPSVRYAQSEQAFEARQNLCDGRRLASSRQSRTSDAAGELPSESSGPEFFLDFWGICRSRLHRWPCKMSSFVSAAVS